MLTVITESIVNDIDKWTKLWKMTVKLSFTGLNETEGVDFAFNYPNFKFKSR